MAERHALDMRSIESVGSPMETHELAKMSHIEHVRAENIPGYKIFRACRDDTW